MAPAGLSLARVEPASQRRPGGGGQPASRLPLWGRLRLFGATQAVGQAGCPFTGEETEAPTSDVNGSGLGDQGEWEWSHTGPSPRRRCVPSLPATALERERKGYVWGV